MIFNASLLVFKLVLYIAEAEMPTKFDNFIIPTSGLILIKSVKYSNINFFL
jgi:hypothetical protein